MSTRRIDAERRFVGWVWALVLVCARSNHQMVADFAEIRCPFGCAEGACLCQDTDGGITPDVSGMMCTAYDDCLDERTLSEVYPTATNVEDETICGFDTADIICPGLCDPERCLPPTCDDRGQNQGEEDIDCGGPCPLPCDLCSPRESELPARSSWADWKGRSWITPIIVRTARVVWGFR